MGLKHCYFVSDAWSGFRHHLLFKVENDQNIGIFHVCLIFFVLCSGYFENRIYIKLFIQDIRNFFLKLFIYFLSFCFLFFVFCLKFMWIFILKFCLFVVDVVVVVNELAFFFCFVCLFFVKKESDS